MSSSNIIGSGATTDEGPLELDLMAAPSLSDKIKAKEIDPEQQKETALKVAAMHQKALNQLVRLDIRNYLGMLTAHGVSGNQKQAIKDSLERAIIAAFDYGVETENVELYQKGELAKYENSFAAHMARLKENGMIIIANKYEEAEKEKLKKIEGEINGEVNEKTSDQEDIKT